MSRQAKHCPAAWDPILHHHGEGQGLGDACPRLPWGHQGPPARWQPGCHFPVPIFTRLDPPGVTWPKPREPNPTLRNPLLLRLCTVPTL